MRPSSMTAAAAAATVGKVATTVEVGAWAGTRRRVAPGDDAEGALGADEELEEGQARDVLDPLATEGQEGPVGEHDVEAEHVVGGDAVLHAAQAPGIGRDVAADRADLVGAGVGRVPEALGGRRPLDLDVEGAGLDHGHPARGVDLDRPHPLGREHDAAVDGEGTTAQARPRAPGHDGDAVRARPAQGRLHVRGRLDPDGCQRGARGGVVVPASNGHRFCGAVRRKIAGVRRSAERGSALTESDERYWHARGAMDHADH